MPTKGVPLGHPVFMPGSRGGRGHAGGVCVWVPARRSDHHPSKNGTTAAPGRVVNPGGPPLAGAIDGAAGGRGQLGLADRSAASQRRTQAGGRPGSAGEIGQAGQRGGQGQVRVGAGAKQSKQGQTGQGYGAGRRQRGTAVGSQHRQGTGQRVRQRRERRDGTGSGQAGESEQSKRQAIRTKQESKSK